MATSFLVSAAASRCHQSPGLGVLALWQIGTDGGYLDRPVKIDPNAPKC
jgi:hypothetical protein